MGPSAQLRAHALPSTLLTDFAYHRPPRGVLMPRTTARRGQETGHLSMDLMLDAEYGWP